MSKQGGWESTGFGQRLRGLRESANLTQQQLADKATCHKQTIVKLERGEQEPAWPLVLALATALGVECDAFQQPVSGRLDPMPSEPSVTEAKEPAKRGRPRKVNESDPGAKPVEPDRGYELEPGAKPVKKPRKPKQA